jgi:hypothetical protein
LEAQGASRATRSFGECTKKEAVRMSAELLHDGSNPASLRIHGLDGRIQEERSYHLGGRSNASAPRRSASSSHRSGSGSSGRSSSGGSRKSGGPSRGPRH